MLKNKVIFPLTTLMILSLCSLTSCNKNEVSSSQTTSSTTTNNNTNSIDGLNYLALTRRIEYAKNNYLTEEKRSLYTEDSIKKLDEAVKEGENLVNNASSQQQIDDAVNKINTAIDNLVTNVKPEKTIDEIAEFMDNAKGNYTLNVKDYYQGSTPLTYQIKSTEKAIYDVSKQVGYIKYDGYVHDFKYVNENFTVGRVHLGEKQDPALYLKENRLDDIVAQIGISEPFTSNGFPLYGGFDKVAGQKYYLTTSTTFFDLTLDLINNRYDSYDGLNGALTALTMELSNDVLSLRLYGKDLNDLKFDLEFSDFNKTTIDGADEFLNNNKEYISSYSPDELINDVKETSKNNYGLKFNVFSHKEGREDQTPNYMITYKNTNDNEYWLSSSTNGIIKSGSTYKNFVFKDNNIEMGNDALYSVKDLDIVNKLLSKYGEFTLLNKTDDYYLDISNNNEMQQMLYRFFELNNYQNVADRNYFGDEPSKIKVADIAKVSLTKNDEGKLVINLFSSLSNDNDGLIVRAVLEDYKTVKVNELEDLASLAKNKLQNYYNEVKNVTGDLYKDDSYRVFSCALNKAQNILNDTNSDITTINDMYTVLNNSYNELELKTASFDENGEEKIKTYLNTYSKYNVSYKMEVTSGNKTLTYIAKYNSYFYSLDTQSGYIMIDNFVHSFHVENNNIIIDNIASNEYGAHFNQIARVQKYFGNFDSLAGIEDYETLSGSYMTRIHNSNKYFTNNLDYLNFIPNLNSENLTGYALELLTNNELKISLYNKTSINMTLDGSNKYELASLNKGEVSSVIKISNLNNASDSSLETFKNANEAIISKEQMLSKLSALPTTYMIKDGTDDIALIGESYYYNPEDSTFYALVKNKVNKYQFYPNFIAEGRENPYELIEAGVKVNNVEATSIEQVTGSLNVLKTLTSDDINLPVDEDTNENTKRYYYSINENKIDEIIKILNIDSEDVGTLSVSYNGNGEIVLANFYSDYSISSYITLSSTYDEMTDIMLSNIIFMLNLE